MKQLILICSFLFLFVGEVAEATETDRPSPDQINFVLESIEATLQPNQGNRVVAVHVLNASVHPVMLTLESTSLAETPTITINKSEQQSVPGIVQSWTVEIKREKAKAGAYTGELILRDQFQVYDRLPVTVTLKSTATQDAQAGEFFKNGLERITAISSPLLTLATQLIGLLLSFYFLSRIPSIVRVRRRFRVEFPKIVNEAGGDLNDFIGALDTRARQDFRSNVEHLRPQFQEHYTRLLGYTPEGFLQVFSSKVDASAEIVNNLKHLTPTALSGIWAVVGNLSQPAGRKIETKLVRKGNKPGQLGVFFSITDLRNRVAPVELTVWESNGSASTPLVQRFEKVLDPATAILAVEAFESHSLEQRRNQRDASGTVSPVVGGRWFVAQMYLALTSLSFMKGYENELFRRAMWSVKAGIAAEATANEDTARWHELPELLGDIYAAWGAFGATKGDTKNAKRDAEDANKQYKLALHHIDRFQKAGGFGRVTHVLPTFDAEFEKKHIRVRIANNYFRLKKQKEGQETMSQIGDVLPLTNARFLYKAAVALVLDAELTSPADPEKMKLARRVLIRMLVYGLTSKRIREYIPDVYELSGTYWRSSRRDPELEPLRTWIGEAQKTIRKLAESNLEELRTSYVTATKKIIESAEIKLRLQTATTVSATGGNAP